MKIKTWNIEAMVGYKPITTFYEDFSIADRFGHAAIIDTYNRGFQTAEALGYKYITELVMVLNLKIWEHYETNALRASVYQHLWESVSEWAQENLKGEELEYFYRTTD